MYLSPLSITVLAIAFLSITALSILTASKLKALAEDASLQQDAYDDKLKEDLRKVNTEMDNLRKDMQDDVDSKLKKQEDTDKAQNAKIGTNAAEIKSIESNIEKNIEPKLILFDGNFKSLNGMISQNAKAIATVKEESANFHSDQLSWNDQFSDQQSTLASKIKEIEDKDFDKRINIIDQTMKDEIIPDIKSNTSQLKEQSKNDKDLVNDLDDLSNKYMTLSDNQNELSTQTLRLADVVDNHDLLVKSS